MAFEISKVFCFHKNFMLSMQSNRENNERLQQISLLKGYHRHKRHIFLCTAKGPCTKGEDISELWEYLKLRLQEIEPNPEEATIARTKSGCLRICNQGPIALVYPEGTLYANLDKEKLDRIIIEHLVNGIIVNEYAISSYPLS